MRKLVLIVALASLAVAAAACSSGAKKAAAPTTTLVDAAGKATACAPNKQLQQFTPTVGSTPTEFRATATRLKALAAQMPVTAPASLNAAAQVEAKDITAGADKLAAVTDKAAANRVLAAMYLQKDPAASSYTNWVAANCLK